MLIVIALGGNALLRRGQVLSAANQVLNIRSAAQSLAAVVAAGHRLVITHGSGPQVGLLALQSAAGPADSALPLDVLDAESAGWIGYDLELALRNALPAGTALVTILTQILVDRDDPAFATPAKPIGPRYDEAIARQLAASHNWSVAPDGKFWRRVVASPRPIEIAELGSIEVLVASGAIVICAGGGGIPVVTDVDGQRHGIEAVIDKDSATALLAQQLNAGKLVMATDVAGAYLDYGTDHARLIAEAHPDDLDVYKAAFASGSMAPKVAAACEFARATGSPATIGALDDLPKILAGVAGTIVSANSRRPILLSASG